MSEEAVRLLRWYVESDLVDGGDEFGAWDDEVRALVEKVWETADYCGCCGNEIEPTDGENAKHWCKRCWPHIAQFRGPLWEQTYEAVHSKPCPFQVPPASVISGGGE